MLCFLDKYQVISEKQFGFQAKVSIEDALVHHVSNITESLDINKKVIAKYLDVEKAFYTVHHSLLFSKLERRGFRGFMLN